MGSGAQAARRVTIVMPPSSYRGGLHRMAPALHDAPRTALRARRTRPATPIKRNKSTLEMPRTEKTQLRPNMFYKIMFFRRFLKLYIETVAKIEFPMKCPPKWSKHY